MHKRGHHEGAEKHSEHAVDEGAYTGVSVGVRLVINVQEEHQRPRQQHENEKLHNQVDNYSLFD